MTAGSELEQPKPPPRRIPLLDRERAKVFRGWYIVGAGGVNQFVASALQNQSFGAYAAALTAEFGWSRGVIGLAFALARVESGLLGPLEGWVIDRFGPRAVMRIGLAIFGLGFIGFSMLWNLPTFFIFFALTALGVSLGGFMPITVTIVNWFDRYRARALGISQVGFGLGGLAAPLVILSITRLGWRETAFASGILILLLIFPLTAPIQRRPEDVGEHVDGISPEEAAARREADRLKRRVDLSTEVDYTPREALRTRAFWMVSLGHAASLFVVSAVQVHLFLHLTDSLGYSDGVAALFIGLMTGMQMVGQIGGGFLGDRISKRTIVIVCMGMHAAGLLLVAHIGEFPLAVVGFALLHGLAWGTRGPLMGAIRADYFGRTSFGVIMGFSSLVLMIGTTAGPIIAGVIYDNTGSYEVGFTIVALIALAGSIFFILAKPPALPKRLAAIGA